MASALANVPSSSANVDETGEILADGIINLFKPAVEEIDDRVRAVRCVVKYHKVYSTDNLWKALCINIVVNLVLTLMSFTGIKHFSLEIYINSSCKLDFKCTTDKCSLFLGSHGHCTCLSDFI